MDTIYVKALNSEEKRVIRRAFKFRLVFFFLFLLPLILGFGFILWDVLQSFYTGTYDLMSIIALLFFPTLMYFMFRYFMPLYRDSYRNLQVKEKQVIETHITHIERRLTSKGYLFDVETTSKSIDSGTMPVLMPGLGYLDMKVGMPIRIHVLANNKFDILRIEKQDAPL